MAKPNPPRAYTADEQIEMAAAWMARTGIRPDEISHNDPMPDPGALMAQVQATDNQMRSFAANFSRQAGIFGRLKAIIFGTEVYGLNTRSLDQGTGQYNGPEMNQ